MDFKISKTLKSLFLKSTVGIFTFIPLTEISAQPFTQNSSSLYEDDVEIASRDDNDRQNRKSKNENRGNWNRDNHQNDHRSNKNHYHEHDVVYNGYNREYYENRGRYYTAPSTNVGYRTSSSRYPANYYRYPTNYSTYNSNSAPIYPTGYAGKIYDYNQNWHNREWHDHDNNERHGNHDHGKRDHDHGKGRGGNEQRDGNRKNDDNQRKDDDHH